MNIIHLENQVEILLSVLKIFAEFGKCPQDEK